MSKRLNKFEEACKQIISEASVDEAPEFDYDEEVKDTNHQYTLKVEEELNFYIDSMKTLLKNIEGLANQYFCDNCKFNAFSCTASINNQIEKLEEIERTENKEMVKEGVDTPDRKSEKFYPKWDKPQIEF